MTTPTPPQAGQIARIAATGGQAAADAARLAWGLGPASIPNPLGVVVDAGAEIGRIAVAVSKAGVWLSRPRNWLRILYVAGGATLIAVGTAMIVQGGKDYALRATGVSGLVGTAVKAVGKGKTSAVTSSS